MPFIDDAVLDDLTAFAALTNRRLDICYTQEPTTYTEATSTFSCGNKTGLSLSGPGNATSGTGRAATVPQITDGSVTATETAGWWAVTDASTTLHATGALSATQAVTSGNTFTLDAIEVIIRDAT